MTQAYEVPEPILNSPFEEPALHWHIEEGQTPEKRSGRRPALYYYRDPKAKPAAHGGMGGTPVIMTLVNQIRQRVKECGRPAIPASRRRRALGRGRECGRQVWALDVRDGGAGFGDTGAD